MVFFASNVLRPDIHPTFLQPGNDSSLDAGDHDLHQLLSGSHARFNLLLGTVVSPKSTQYGPCKLRGFCSNLTTLVHTTVRSQIGYFVWQCAGHIGSSNLAIAECVGLFSEVSAVIVGESRSRLSSLRIHTLSVNHTEGCPFLAVACFCELEDVYTRLPYKKY